jgi:hypothetical protein
MITLPAILIGFDSTEWRIEQRGIAVLGGPPWRQRRCFGLSVGSLHLEARWLWFWRGRDAQTGSWGSHIIEDPVVEVEDGGLAAGGRLRGRGRAAGRGLCGGGLEGGDAGLDGSRGRHGGAVLGSAREWRRVSNSARTRPHV